MSDESYLGITKKEGKQWDPMNFNKDEPEPLTEERFRQMLEEIKEGKWDLPAPPTVVSIKEWRERMIDEMGRREGWW